MGTVMNGKKWAGACVNGKVVSGLVKNGVVFYRKPVSKYRRRIIVGDDLSNRTIFQDIPEGFYTNDIADGRQRNIISSNDMDIMEYYSGGIYSIQCISSNGFEYVYRYDVISGRVIIKPTNITIQNNLNAIVTQILENEAYRHLFIEDENIRPLKVGDKIVPGTKFYGVVPDEPNLNGISTYIYNTNGTAVAYFNFKEGNMIHELQVKTDDQYSYTILYSKNPFATVNKSVLTSNTSYTIGEITNQSNPNFNYLLVDTTTLGA